MKFSKEQINKQLIKITENRHFNKSKISCDLLTYLVLATLEEKELKEFTIGIELFGKKYTDDTKPDANIRVYIHNLRKKLHDYYSSDGKKDPVIFEIEKGKYTVHFSSIKQKKALTSKQYLRLLLITSLLLLISLSTSTWLLLRTPEKSEWKNMLIWTDLIKSEKKTLLVLGDHFVFSGILPTGNIGIYRDFNINSENDFEHLLDKNPDMMRQFTKSALTYLSKMSVFCQNDILKVFSNTETQTGVKLSSDLQPTDLKDYNIIFVGNYKNMGLFESIIKDIPLSFGISNGEKQYIFSKDPNATIYSPGLEKQKQTDYSLVIYKQGYNDNHFLFFLSSQDIGNISTVGRLSDKNFIQQLQKKHLNKTDPQNFSLLFKVEGLNKTDLSCELIIVE